MKSKNNWGVKIWIWIDTELLSLVAFNFDLEEFFLQLT